MHALRTSHRSPAVASLPMRRPIRWSVLQVGAARAMRVGVGILLGLIASLVLLLSLHMLARAGGRPPLASGVNSAVLLSGWVLAATTLLYRASGLWAVGARACLLGAVQWSAVIPIVLLLASGAVPINSLEGQVVKYHLKLILGSSAAALALLCLSGYACIAVARRVRRRWARLRPRSE